VETQQQLIMLEEAGCTDIQGYLFSRPVPGDRVIDLLQTMSITNDILHRDEYDPGDPVAAGVPQPAL
jgi:predicted signal transduction protein with EAL and GGDEF domain